MSEKVIVGMSGGVDSSVAAAILKERGFDVEGMYLILTPTQDSSAAADAEAVAKKLGIPFHIVDMKKEFSALVIDYFVGEYENGRTPNPCVVCNERIKFGLMLDKAIELGADYIATGHYAKVLEKDGKYLLKATDSKKDQSYFLYRLSQEQLSHVIFPMVDMEKDETRQIARDLGLPVAEKRDSQEICFVPDNDYVRFLKEYANIEGVPGDFVNLAGEKIGEHKGIINYTVGQRKGLGAFGEPVFVTKIDAKTNEVVLAPEGFQSNSECVVENLSSPLDGEAKLLVKIRYRANKAPALVTPLPDGSVKVIFDEPQRAITPGQSAVFYDDEGTVVSGGFISH